MFWVEFHPQKETREREGKKERERGRKGTEREGEVKRERRERTVTVSGRCP